jgi:hypothetical protein
MRSGMVKKISWVLAILLLASASSYVFGYWQGTGALPGSLFPRASVVPIKITTGQTFSQVSSFVAGDKTNEQIYTEGMNCVDYALLLARNAEWEGLDAVIVRLDFDEGLSHALLMFPTSDRGYVFIEPQTDKEFHPAVGKPFDGRAVTAMWVLTFDWIPYDEFMKGADTTG